VVSGAAYSLLQQYRTTTAEESKKINKTVAEFEALKLTSYEKEVIKHVTYPSGIKETQDDIGGLEKVKQGMQDLFRILELKDCKSPLLTTPRGIAFCGPPGTGKTLCARVVAKQSGAVFIEVNQSWLQDKFFGESVRMIDAIFTLARKLQPNPVVIFVDEIDSFLRKRDLSDQDVTAAMKNEFMRSWDGLNTNDQHKIVVLACTNRWSQLDDAVKRRLPRQFEFKKPDQEARTKILEVILAADKHDKLDINKIVELTGGFTGSDLRELCKAAAILQLREHDMRKDSTFRISNRNFEEAMKVVHATETEEDD